MYPCDFDHVDLPEFNKGKTAWMYPQNSMLQPIFDKALFEMDESGVLARHDPMNGIAGRFCSNTEFIQVDFGFTAVIFILITSGAILSILIFIGELIWSILKKYF